MKKRNYTQEDVQRLQGSVQIEHTLARRGATKLRELLANEPYINTLGAYNGQQAVQHDDFGGIHATPLNAAPFVRGAQ